MERRRRVRRFSIRGLSLLAGALLCLAACNEANSGAGPAGPGGQSAGVGQGGTPGQGGISGQGGTPGQGGAGGTIAGPEAIRLPEIDAPFDYQIGGAYSPPAGVKVVSRDRHDKPAADLFNLCYVNGFQVQPNEEAWWQKNHADLLLKDSKGNLIKDTQWNELIFDTRTASQRTMLSEVIGGWIRQCAADGFQAVEIDNLDSYSRSQNLLTQDNNVTLMALLSAAAHQAGLASGQKNSSELLERRTAMNTDFAVVEECNRYAECDQFQKAYNGRIFIIEYRRQDFDKGCKAFSGLSIVLRDLSVKPAGSAGYVFDGC